MSIPSFKRNIFYLFRVKKIPNSISNLQNLRGLYLSSNQLAEVPASLSRCVELQECYLDNNLMVTIPDCLTSLPMLNIMSLANNRLGNDIVITLCPSIMSLQ